MSISPNGIEIEESVQPCDDRAAKKAEEIVSEWRNRGTPIDERLARLVAAELRVIRQEEQALANEKCRCFLERAEKAEAEIARLRARLCVKDEAISRLDDKFSCGHRKIDWDDSYGECACCKMKKVAHDYDALPHTAIKCHDEIEALQAEIAHLREELAKVKP